MADTSLKYVIEAIDKASDTFESISSKFEDMGESSKKSAALMAGGGAVAAAGLGAFAQGFDQLTEGQTVLAEVSASMDATEAQTKAFGDAAKEVFANNFAGSLGDASQAVGDVVGNITSLKDASESEISKATSYASAFAKVFDTDVSTAAGNAQRLIQNGLAPNVEAAFDAMTAGAQKLPKSIRDEAIDAVNEYSSSFGQLGFSADEAFALMATQTENGAYGVDKMGDALKEFTIRSTDMSTASVAAFDTLGLNAGDMANKVLAGGDSASGAMAQIVTALQGIKDPATQANTAIALFGTPLEDLGTQDIPKFLDSLASIPGSMADTTGAAQEMSDTLSDTATNGWQTLLNAMQTGLAEGLEPLMGPLQAVSRFMAENGDVMRIVAPILAGLAVVFGTLTAAVGLFTSGVWASTVALLANPITWIVVGVMALIAAIILLVANWDTVTQALSTGWQWVVDQFTAGWEWIKGIFSTVGQWFMDNVWSPISTLFTNLFTVLTWPFRTAMAALQQIWIIIGPWVQANIVQPVSRFFSLMGQAISQVITSVKGWFTSVWGSISGWVSSHVVEPVKRVFGTITAVVQDVINRVVGIFHTITGAIGGALSSVGNAIISPFRNAFNSIASLWNRTVGSLSFTIPGWVPNIGGNSFGVPKIPMLAEGGIVNKATLALIGEAGPEAVVPLDRAPEMGMGGGSAAEIMKAVYALVDAVTEQKIRAALARG